MGRAISLDLRVRMVRGIAVGRSRRLVAAQFEVAPSTAVRVQARYAATGSVAPAKQGASTRFWQAGAVPDGDHRVGESQTRHHHAHACRLVRGRAWGAG
jgi:hypothetical protein